MKPLRRLLPLLLSSLATAHAGDPEGKANLAAESPLPRGAGFATKFAADREIAKHAAVIFADDFETGELGTSWDDRRDEGGKVLSLGKPGDSAPLGDRCLRVESHLDRDTGGGFTKWFQPVDTVFIRFYTRFHEKCDYVHHFVTLRANKGLEGKDKWSGFGGAGLKPDGIDRFSTAIEPWGNWSKSPPPGRWNFYTYWPDMKVSGDGKYWGNSFSVPAAPPVPRGKWICVEFMLRHNTPDQADGEHAFWIDGQLQGHWKGIAWRKSPTLMANALTLESYVTDRWTRNPVNIVEFDNVVIAKSYIGPSGK